MDADQARRLGGRIQELATTIRTLCAENAQLSRENDEVRRVARESIASRDIKLRAMEQCLKEQHARIAEQDVRLSQQERLLSDRLTTVYRGDRPRYTAGPGQRVASWNVPPGYTAGCAIEHDRPVMPIEEHNRESGETS